MTIHTEWYRIFQYAAKAGNLTKAARRLHMTQPSVSYAIKQLEEALEVRLFDRLSKGVKITREGEQLLDYVNQAFAQLDAGEQHIRRLQQYQSGQIRIGASGALIKEVLLPLLDAFHRQYPRIAIRLTQESTRHVVDHVKAGKLDMGFVHLPLHDSDIETRPILSIQEGFVVGEAFRDACRHPVSANELNQLPLLLLSAGSSTRRFMEEWFAEQNVEAEGDIELSSIDMLIEFAVRGYGAAFISRTYITDEINNGALFELKTSVPIPKRTIGLAMRRRASLSLAADKWLEHVKRLYPAPSDAGD